MAAELVALLGDLEAGRVRRDRRGRLSFIAARQALLHAEGRDDNPVARRPRCHEPSHSRPCPHGTNSWLNRLFPPTRKMTARRPRQTHIRSVVC